MRATSTLKGKHRSRARSGSISTALSPSSTPRCGNTPFLFRLLTSKRASSLLAFLNYDLFFSRRISSIAAFCRACAIDRRECVEPPESLDTPRKIFERKLRYWECRPMSERPDEIVSPADSRMLMGSLKGIPDSS